MNSETGPYISLCVCVCVCVWYRAELEWIDEFGDRAIHLTVYDNQSQVMSLLLSLGADVNAANALVFFWLFFFNIFLHQGSSHVAALSLGADVNSANVQFSSILIYF